MRGTVVQVLLFAATLGGPFRDSEGSAELSSRVEQMDSNANDTRRDAERQSEEPGGLPLLSGALAIDPSRRCDVTFHDLQFYFSSPDFPRPYSNNLDCVVTVKRSQEVCVLRLTFQKFDVWPSVGCHSDFLQVEEDRKWCGTLPSETISDHSFAGTDLRLKFHTDAFGTAPGFFVRAEQVPCGRDDGLGLEERCDVVVDQQQFDITGRDWPLTDGALDCIFVIRKFHLRVCFLQFVFVVVDLNCQFEYLDVGPQRFCDRPADPLQLVDFLGSEFVVRFHSDRIDSSSRLMVRVIQRTCEYVAPRTPLPGPSKGICRLDSEYGGGTTTSARNFLLRSPSTPYPANLDCTYVVRRNSPDVCSLVLLVREFDFVASPNCEVEFLAIGSERLCGFLPRGNVRTFDFRSNEIPIRFVTDSIPRSGRGFAVSVWQRDCKSVSVQPPTQVSGLDCDAVFTARSFALWSNPVSSTVACTYTVWRSGSDICSLQLHFRTFDFGSVDPRCAVSFLDVKGDRFCARFVEGTTRTYSFDEPYIRIVYRAGFGEPRFHIWASQQPCQRDPPVRPPICVQGGGLDAAVLSNGAFRLRSTGYPSQYGSSVDCVFVVRRASPRVCRLQLDFDDFDLEASERCDDDFLQVDDVRFCRNEAAGTRKMFDFVGPELYVRFRSVANEKSVSSGRRGFHLRGAQLECYIPSRRDCRFHGNRKLG